MDDQQVQTLVDPLSDGEDCQIVVAKNWMEEEKSTALFERLVNEIPWEQKYLKIMGKDILEPRLTYAMGDEGVVHKYTGTVTKVSAWDEEIKAIADRIFEETNFNTNACLLNYYVDGSNYIGWHSDKEVSPPDYGVVTISLGGSRDFIIRKKKDKNISHTVLLENGDACMMGGNTQKFWKHSIPKRKKQNDPRISLTFRRLKGEKQ